MKVITPLFKVRPLARIIRRLVTFTGTLSVSLLSCMPIAAESAEYAAISVGENDLLSLESGDRVQVTGSANNLCGICNNTGAINSQLNLANDVTINVNGPVAGGIMLKGNNAQLDANRLNVNVTGHYGIEADAQQARLNLGSGSRIEVNNNTLISYGIYLSNQSLLSADALTIINNGAGTGLYITDAATQADIGTDSVIQTQGAQSAGVYIFGRDTHSSGTPARLQANRLTVATSGDLAYGVNIQANSEVDLGRQSTITTRGENAMGIWNLGTLTADELHIRTYGGDRANALEVRQKGIANIGAGSELYSENSGALVASGEAATINFNGSETQRNTLFSGGTYAASAQYTGANVNLSYTDVTIQNQNPLSLGLWAMSGGHIQGDHLTITGSSGSIGVYAMTGSEIDLSGKTVIRMDSPLDMALSTQNDLGYRASAIRLNGLVDIIGSVQAVGGIIELDMMAGSQLNGAVSSDGINGGHLNITMTQSQWKMPMSSVVDNLTLDSSTVDFTAEKMGSRLTVGNLAGSGTFAMKTDIVEQRSDMLVVTGSSAGSHYLQLNNRGGLATTGQEVITLVDTQDGLARFALAPGAEKVELGGYLYGLRQAGTDWQLAATGKADSPASNTPEAEAPDAPASNIPEAETPDAPASNIPQDDAPASNTPEAEATDPAARPVPPPPSTPQPAPAPPEISSTADAGANFLNINYLLNYAETQTLLQRLGDLRQKEQQGNVWLRGIGGRFDDFSGGKLSRFSLSYSGMQLGMDKQIAPEMPVTVGAFMGVTNGNAHYHSGRGDLKSSHAGFYLSAIADNGLWLDGVVKYARMKNSFSVHDSQGAMVTGNGAADSYSASLEGGKRFSLSQSEQGFYLEPQLQFAWSHQENERFRASNGLQVDLDGYDSLLGRASALVGYQIEQSGLRLNLYVKSGVVREFKGDTHYRLNGSAERHSFKGDWWNNGVGMSAQIAGQHVIYLEGDSATGEKFNQRQFNAGYRFSF